MKRYFFFSISFFLFSIPLKAQKQLKLISADSSKVFHIQQKKNLTPFQKFQEHMDRHPELTQMSKPFVVTPFNSNMPVHTPKGRYKMKVVPIDSTYGYHLKVFKIRE